MRTRTVPRNPYSVLDVVVVGLSKRRRRRRPQSAPSCNVSTASSSPSAVIGSVGHQPLPPLVALALGAGTILGVRFIFMALAKWGAKADENLRVAICLWKCFCWSLMELFVLLFTALLCVRSGWLLPP